MEVAYNRPMKLDTDTSNESMQPDTMLDAFNVRLFQNGSDTVLTNLEGMKQAFQISQGFSVCGWCQYNSVLYISSVSATHFEIGTYPSKENGVFQDTYKPIHNYVRSLDYNALIRTGTPIPQSLIFDFTIDNSKLNYSLGNRLDMMPKENYDGSVSVIIVDGKNPNRVFNLGVDKYVNKLIRYINDQDIENLSTEQFNELANLSTIRLNRLDNDGVLGSGQYFFYIRYSNQDKSPTSFIAHSGPISVYHGDGLTVRGGYDEKTNKSIVLDIFNIERSYAFFEIGYLKYSAGISTGYLIENLYSTDSDSKQLKINGLESITNVLVDEFLAFKPYEKTCKSQTQIYNRWYGANWKSTNRHHQDLVNFAKATIISEQARIIGTDKINNYINGVNEDTNAFNRAKDVNQSLGYFSGETYLFLLHPVFIDGRIGLGYPMKGADNYWGDMKNPNTEGVFRFSSQQFFSVLQNNMIYGKYPKFDFPQATQWIEANVSGWYISRAKRKENLMYQGYGTDVYNGDVWTDMANQWSDLTYANINEFDILVKEKDLYLPLVKPSSYYVLRQGKADRTQRGFAYGIKTDIKNQHQRAESKGAIFSTDYIIGNHIGESATKDGYILPLFDVELSVQGRETTSSSITWFNGINVVNWKDGDLSAYHESKRTLPKGVGVEDVKCFNISPWSESSNNGFTSKVQEGSETPNANGFYYLQNEISLNKDDYAISLPMATPAYIGIERKDLNINQKIVNLYSANPETVNYLNWYDYKNESVFICSAFIKKGTMSFTASMGDCFTQRVFLKAIHGDNKWSEFLVKDVIDGLTTGKDEKDGYGHLLSFVSESKYNAAFRFEKGGNRFYPTTGFDDIGEFAFTYGEPESPFYDTSYSEVLESRILRGFNPQTYYAADKYPARIMYSAVQAPNALFDAYRIVLPAQLQDFDMQYGEIVRIIEERNSILSFQERAINRHTIQEKVYSPSTDGSPVLLGMANILTEFVQRLSDTYGSQHQWSVIKTPSGTYCVDANKRVILMIQEGIEAISITKKVDRLVTHTIDSLTLSTSSNITHNLSDITLDGVGIHGVYDEKNKEVLFTFLSQNTKETICFSELAQSFISRYGFAPNIYLNLNRDLFSMFETKGFIHDEDDIVFNRFYNILSHSSIEIAIGKDTYYPKRFDAHVITSNNVTFDRFDWRTQHQESDLTVSSAPYWHLPRYKKNQWHLSIPRAKTASGDLSIFDRESPLVGLVMFLAIKYADSKRMWLKEVLTKFVKSSL